MTVWVVMSKPSGSTFWELDSVWSSEELAESQCGLLVAAGRCAKCFDELVDENR